MSIDSSSTFGPRMKPTAPASSATWSSEETIALSVIIFTIMITSFSGNLLILIVFVRSKRLLSSFANKLVLSLAVADLATASFPINYQLATVVETSVISNEGVLCTMGGLSSYTVFLISILTMVMLSVDRFIALGYPLKYNLRISSSLKAFMLAWPWLYGLIFGLFCGVFIKIKFDPESMDCGFNWKGRHFGFIMFVLVAHFVVPFAVLVVMNVMTLRLVRCQNRIPIRQESAIHMRGTGTGVATADLSRRRAVSETKLAKISMAIVLAFLLCWTPYVITRALSVYCCHVPSIVLTGAIVTVDLTSLINPVIYSSLRSDLRQSIRNLFIKPSSVMRVHPLAQDVSMKSSVNQSGV